MKLTTAKFWIAHVQTDYRVTFHGTEVVVETGIGFHKLLTVNNKSRRYKPCATHAMDLLRLALGKPVKCEQEKQRRRAVKPSLKLIG